MFAALLILVIAGAQSPPGAPPRDSREATASATISGRVTEQGSGRQLPRIVVTLTMTARGKVIEAMTDAGGRYEFTGLEAGKYAIVAAPDEHRSTYLAQRFGDTAPGFIAVGPVPSSIDLTAGEGRVGVDIALARGLGIEGRVTDPWDDPIAEAQMEVRRADGRLHFGYPVYSDDLGFYRVFGLAPGRYRVCASAQDRFGGSDTAPSRLVPTCHPAALVESGASDIVLTSQDATGVDIRVQRVGSHSISGTVSGPSGDPIMAPRSARIHWTTSVSNSTQSRNGAFALQGLTPGRYVIKARLGDPHREEPRPPGRELQVGYASADVDVVDVTGVVVDLSKPARAAGRVVFEGTPAPRTSLLRMVVQANPPDARWSMFEGRPPFSPVRRFQWRTTSP